MNIHQNLGIASSVYKEGEFYGYYNTYSSEDLVNGTLNNNCKFEMAEVYTRDVDTDSDGKPTEIPDFHGLFAKIEMKKPFNTVLYIRKDKNSKGIISKLFKVKYPFDKLKVELDSQEFEKQYDIYATDQIVAMQLLTADVMQEILEFQKSNDDFEITIKNNSLYIRFLCGKSFEIEDLMMHTLDKKAVYNNYLRLVFVFSLINKWIKILDETQYN